jgi:hypothetical protein
MRILLAAGVALSLTACASQEPTLQASTAPLIVASNPGALTADTKLACHKEASLGSHMLHTVCEAPQSEADRNAMQQGLRNIAPPNAVTARAPG